MSRPAWAEEPGLSQVVCGCLGETFHFVVTDLTVAMVCAGCGQVNGTFDRPADWQPFGEHHGPAFMEPGSMLPNTVAGAPPPARPSPVQAGWASEAGIPQPSVAAEMRDTLASASADQIDKLGPPEASPAYANAVLRGGHWPGRALALPGGVEHIGLPDGQYTRREQDELGRWVYELTTPGGKL